MIRVVCVALSLALCLAQTGQAGEAFKPTRVDGSPLWPVHYYTPPDGKAIDGLVILISDNQGWDDAATALAQHLAAGGNTVVGLELSVYRAALAHEDHECTLVTRDLETTARNIEETLPFSQYRPPVIVGIGAGAGIAYAAAAQVMPNTFAASIALRFDPTFDVGHKMCLPLVTPEARRCAMGRSAIRIQNGSWRRPRRSSSRRPRPLPRPTAGWTNSSPACRRRIRSRPRTTISPRSMRR